MPQRERERKKKRKYYFNEKRERSLIKYYWVCLVRGVEKWENRKLWEDGKYFIFSHFYLVGSEKVEEWKK